MYLCGGHISNGFATPPPSGCLALQNPSPTFPVWNAWQSSSLIRINPDKNKKTVWCSILKSRAFLKGGAVNFGLKNGAGEKIKQKEFGNWGAFQSIIFYLYFFFTRLRITMWWPFQGENNSFHADFRLHPFAQPMATLEVMQRDSFAR